MSIPEIKHILYATDLSDHARHAMNYAVSLADRLGAEVTVLHVMEPLSPTAMTVISTYLDDAQMGKITSDKQASAVEIMTQRIESLCTEIQATCPHTHQLIKRGHPVEEIVNEIRKGDYDLVVMGSRGLGRFQEAVMGSTTRRVLRRSEKPVLVVRLPKDKG